MIGLADDVVEQKRAAAVEMLLDAGDLEIRIDRCIGFDQVAFLAQEVDGAPEIPKRIRDRRWLELFSG